MGFIALILDIVIVALIVLGIFIGWKKGFVTCFIDFIGIIVVIFLTFTLSPVLANTLTEKTNIDENIYNTIYKSLSIENPESGQNMQNLIESGIAKTVNKSIESNAEQATKVIMNVISFLIIFVVLQIIILIIKIVINAVAFLPVIKQFNEILGALFNGFATIIKLMVLMCIVYFSVKAFNITQVNEVIEKSNIAKVMYNHNIITNHILDKIN